MSYTNFVEVTEINVEVTEINIDDVDSDKIIQPGTKQYW